MAAQFFGRFEHSLDAKGRVILPARFRGHFDTQAYVSQHHDRCLAMWTPEEFQKQVEVMQEMQSRSPDDRNVVRVWAAGLAEVEIDKQGRVALPQYLRDFARLDGQVLIHGALDRVEFWNPEEFSARVAPSEAAFTDPPGASAPPAVPAP